MNTSRRKIIKLSVITAVSMAVSGCGSENEFFNDLFSVRLYPDDLMVVHDSNVIILEFNQPIVPDTLDQNIYLQDKTGNLIHLHTVTLDPDDPSHQRIFINLKDEVYLNESWKYSVIVTEQVTSISGESLSTPVSLEFITTSQHPFASTSTENTARTKIVVISDLHMNEERAKEDKYSLFTENTELLYAFLEQVQTSDKIKELVILGDLLDMWVIPMAYHTFQGTINNNKEYFQGVANADVNSKVIRKINEIADDGIIRFSYVPGNHDMLFTEEIFYSIFPNGFWEGIEEGVEVKPGSGVYYPEPGIALEHGHNYDLFNAPDPLTTEGSILPPGYFVTRVYATGNLINSQKSPIQVPEGIFENETDELIYTMGWGAAMIAINIPDIQYNEPQIITGVDGYSELYSPDSARDIYTKTIGPNWEQRQTSNGVYKHEDFLTAELNGLGTLELSAVFQYFRPNRAKIVVFGHTHKAMISKSVWTTPKIYANSGTWINEEYIHKGTLTATCIILNSSESSGSDLDNVALYQTIEKEDGSLTLQLVKEENLDTTI